MAIGRDRNLKKVEIVWKAIGSNYTQRACCMKSKNTMKKRCNHKNLGLEEVVPAVHEYTIVDGKLDTVCKMGYGAKESVVCYSCGKSWLINNSSPKFIKAFYKQISELID